MSILQKTFAFSSIVMTGRLKSISLIEIGFSLELTLKNIFLELL